MTDTKKIDDGGPVWKPIVTADKDADRMLLGIVRNDVLEEVHVGGYRYATLSTGTPKTWGEWEREKQNEEGP